MTGSYIQKNPKELVKKLGINNFRKVAGYKTYSNQLHSFTLMMKHLKKENHPFTIPSRTIKQLGINLAKEVKEMYDENYRTFLKEIEEDTNKWKDICVPRLEELILWK